MERLPDYLPFDMHLLRQPPTITHVIKSKIFCVTNLWLLCRLTLSALCTEPDFKET